MSSYIPNIYARGIEKAHNTELSFCQKKEALPLGHAPFVQKMISVSPDELIPLHHFTAVYLCRIGCAVIFKCDRDICSGICQSLRINTDRTL